MTDPASRTDVGAALEAWAHRTFGGAVSVAEGPTAITGGYDTYIYRFRLQGPVEGLAAGPLVLRLYPSAARGDSALREAAVLRFLHGAAFPAPRPLEASAELDDFGQPYVVMEELAGCTVLDRVSSNRRRIGSLLDALATAHAALHRLDPGDWPAPPEPGTEEVDRRLDRARSAALPPTEGDGLGRALAWLETNRDRARGEAPSVCHYDVHPMNALVDDDGRVALIDWEGAGVGARHSDLARSLVLFEWAPVVASSRVERVVLRAARPFLVRSYREAYARHLPIEADRLHYWMALHAADAWADSVALQQGTFDRATRTDTRVGQAAAMGMAMEKLFRRLVPEA